MSPSLTARGATTAVAGVVLVAGGIAIGYPSVQALGLTALIAVGCALAYVARVPRLEVRRETYPDRLSRGETAVCALTLVNRGRVAARSVDIEDRFGSERRRLPIGALPPGCDTVITYRVTVGRRGRMPLGPVRWWRADPLGLAFAQRDLGGVEETFVHPAVHAIGLHAAGSPRGLEGQVLAAARGGTIFHKLRAYVPGDDLRLIHWRSSARVGELMVREHGDVSLPAAVVVLETDPDAYPDGQSFEEAVDVAASAVVSAVRDGLPTRCVIGDEHVTAAPGCREVLDRLADVSLRPSGASPGGTAAKRALLDAPSGAVLVLVTGRPNPIDPLITTRVRHTYVGVIGPVAPASTASTTYVRGEVATALCARWGKRKAVR